MRIYVWWISSSIRMTRVYAGEMFTSKTLRFISRHIITSTQQHHNGTTSNSSFARPHSLRHRQLDRTVSGAPRRQYAPSCWAWKRPHPLHGWKRLNRRTNVLVAYFTTDEVNEWMAERMAAECGLTLCSWCRRKTGPARP